MERFMIWLYYYVSEIFLKVKDQVKIQKSGETKKQGYQKNTGESWTKIQNTVNLS